MAPPLVQETLSIEGIDALSLLGHGDGNLRALEQRFNVALAARGGRLVVKGAAEAVTAASSVLRALIERVRAGREITSEDLEYLLNVSDAPPGDLPQAGVLPEDGIVFFGDKRVVKVRTPVQARYVEALLADDIVFGIGPAGTGKTYLAVAVALRLLREKAIEKIVLTRPAVEAGESLGFLPGDMQEKVDPYLRPLYDAMQDMVHYEKLQRFLQLGVIEVVPLAYMRGRTLARSLVILDEAQNATLTQMKMFLTRLGPGSKACITGDVTQIDLEHPDKSGLVLIQEILADVAGIQFLYFSEKDVVRHRLVRDIILAFDRKRPGNEAPER